MPGCNWALNLVGVPLSDEKLAKVPYPKWELTTHVTTKTVQAFSFMGAGMIAPATCLIKGERDMKHMKERAYQYGMYGVALGMVLGPYLTYSRLRGVDGLKNADPAYDRAYRIRCNKSQMRVDRVGVYGLLVGIGAACYVGEDVARGAFFGFTGGWMLGALLNVAF